MGEKNMNWFSKSEFTNETSFKTIIGKMVRILKLMPKFLDSYNYMKFFPHWLNSVLLSHTSLKDHVPWITFEATKWLIRYLTTNMRVFEYGSGGSTIFLSKRVHELISVEHDRDWYITVLNELAKENVTNCKIMLKEPELDIFNKTDPSNPKSFLSSVSTYQGYNFKNYAMIINEYADESFDLVIIDGRARPACIASALPKIRPGGYLILDNSERKRYYQGRNLLKDWEVKEFYGVGPYCYNLWGTTIWKKSPKLL